MDKLKKLWHKLGKNFVGAASVSLMFVLFMIILAFLLVGGLTSPNSLTPKPSPTPTPFPTSTPMPLPTVTPTPIPGAPTATPTPGVPGATATPTPGTLPPPPPPGNSGGMLVSPQELAQLPASGAAWNALKATADGNLGTAAISNQDSNHDVATLAVALVYAKTGDTAYRTKAMNAIMSAMETENGGRVLALARNLPSYVIAADLINLKEFNPANDQRFRTWLSGVRNEQMTECDTIILCHERRPNNWGLHAGSSRIAADIYLGDTADLQRAAQVFRGWMGDRGAYANFQYGDLSWQCNPSAPVGLNPKGCSKNGNSLDGVMPDDQRRCGSYQWPPCVTNYAWGALEGANTSAVLLYRAGYTDVWNWSDRGLLRAVQWLYSSGNNPATGDDEWQPWITNRYYGTSFPTASPARPGKNLGWTDWLYQ